MSRILSGSTEPQYTYDPAMNAGSLLCVLSLATIGGWAINFIFGVRLPPYLKWCKMDSSWTGYIHKISMPALLGQLCMGIIARNALPDLMAYYPEDVATWLRQMAMAILMLIGGMELEFEGRGGVMLMLTFMPMVFEVVGFTLAGVYLMDMTLTFAITTGFVLAAVSPGVLIPILIKLKDGGYGMQKGIPYLIIGAASFDDIVCITGFMVSATFAYNEFESEENQQAAGPIIGRCFMEVAIGIATGFGAGLFAYPLKKAHKYVKFVKASITVCALVALHYVYHWFAGEFLCAIIYGFTIYRIWGSDHKTGKPMHEVEMLWGIMTPCLFGTIGAALDFEKLNKDVLGMTVVCICIGVVFRTVAAYFSVYEKQYSWREKMFTAISWIPKGSVNAVCGGMVTDHALKMTSGDIESVKYYGEIALTAALVSVLMTAPFGAIFSMLLGPMWLEKETDEQKLEREKGEMDFMGKEKFEEEKAKEELMKGSTSGKTLGIDPKFMIARSASSRSHASYRGVNKSKKSDDGKKLKDELDKLNQNVVQNNRKESDQQKQGYEQVKVTEEVGQKPKPSNTEVQKVPQTNQKDIELESCEFQSETKSDNKKSSKQPDNKKHASKNIF